jgi:hypothetical protein
MLEKDPKKRISASDAVNHRVFNPVRNGYVTFSFLFLFYFSFFYNNYS